MNRMSYLVSVTICLRVGLIVAPGSVAEPWA